MKNILTKIEFHYTYIIMALGLVLTGHFINLIVFTSLIIIHELGHYITSIIFKYKVDKIIIYPYGGVTKLNTIINTNITKDLVVAVSGIIFQTLYFIIIFFLYKNNIIREYTYNLFLLYHKSMLVFNLLPILPLDGGKIFLLLIEAIRKKPLKQKTEIGIQMAGFVLLIGLSIFVTYNDIVRIF